MLLVKTYLEKSAIHGLGVFAGEFIAKGTKIWRFVEDFDRAYSPKQFAATAQAGARIHPAARLPGRRRNSSHHRQRPPHESFVRAEYLFAKGGYAIARRNIRKGARDHQRLPGIRRGVLRGVFKERRVAPRAYGPRPAAAQFSQIEGLAVIGRPPGLANRPNVDHPCRRRLQKQQGAEQHDGEKRRGSNNRSICRQRRWTTRKYRRCISKIIGADRRGIFLRRHRLHDLRLARSLHPVSRSSRPGRKSPRSAAPPFSACSSAPPARANSATGSAAASSISSTCCCSACSPSSARWRRA